MARASKWDVLRRRVIWIFVILLVPSFILFFGATGRSMAPGPGGTAGVIFGRKIPWDRFEEERQWLRRELEAQMGKNVPEQLLQPLLTQSTWDRLIILEEARRKRLRVDDLELAIFIQKIPAFQEHGGFVADRYHRYLAATGTSPQVFEERLRNDLLIQKLVDSVKASVSVREDEMKAAYHKAHDTLAASLLLAESSTFTRAAAAVLADADLHAYYDAHPEAVQLPAHVAFEYTGRSREELASGLTLSDDELKDYYEAHQDQFAKEDRTVKPLNEVREAVRQQLTDERVHKQLIELGLDLQDDEDAKRTFEEILAVRKLPRHAVGPVPVGSPWGQGVPDPAVLEAVAELKEGELSPVIQTDRGVYLARVAKRIPSRIPPFEEVRQTVRDRLVQELARAQARKTAQAWHTELAARQAAGMRFEEAVLVDGLALSEPTPFTRTQPIDRLGSAPAANDAAFATPLGGITEVIETRGGFAILRPEALLPADESKLPEARADLHRDLVTQQETAKVSTWLNDLRTRAKLKNFVNQAP